MRVNLFGVGTKSESWAITAQRRINCLVSPQKELDRTAFALIGRPGLSNFVSSIGANPSRGLWAVNSLATPLLFSVHGNALLSIDSGANVTAIGTISTSTGDVSMADNGTYLVIVDGANGYYYDMVTPGALTQIVDGNFTTTPKTVTYQDTYFIVTGAGRQFQLSANENPVTWPALNIGFAGAGGGALVAGKAANNILQLFGDSYAEFWQNANAADLPYARIPGAAQQFGLASATSLTLFDNALAGVFVNDEGARNIARMQGFNLRKLSDPDIDDLLFSYATVSDAQGYAAMFGGHPLLIESFPTADVTHVYDGLADAWSEWQATDGTRFWGLKFAKFVNKLVVSDRRNGMLYELNASAYDDAGSTIPMEVVSKHIWQDDKEIGIERIQIDMEQGVGQGVGQGADPHIELEVSKDGGNTFTSVGFRSIGQVGEYTTRVIWNTLGSARDWVLKLRITDPVKRVITGASAEIRVGAY